MKNAKNKTVVWIIVIVAILTLEMVFDVFEIMMGKYLLVINPKRPQIGRLWEEEQKDILAEEEVKQVDTFTTDSLHIEIIPNFYELLKLLEKQSMIILDQNNFKNFYKRIEPSLAVRLLDPLILYDLDRQNEWRFVKINKSSAQITFTFINGFYQPLSESFLDIKNINSSPLTKITDMDRDPQLQQRIVPASDFLLAFDQLSRPYRLQIFNNPYRLIEIKDELVRVGISKYAKNGSVELTFEVKVGNSVSLFKMNAAEIAAGYLISTINRSEKYNMALPSKKEDESE